MVANSQRQPVVALVALVLGLAACSLPTALMGGREWIISVENQSNMPARLAVAEDTMPMGNTVGTARPATVPAGATVEVSFTVPPGEGWAIFVNPSPELGPLITEPDVPDSAAGRLPLTILVLPDGDVVVSTPDDPGWFGNT